ncbi:MAG TPA: enoyl-CoA hydratase-related protein [Myxococcaceae bacterium]|jgi:enoyl-CoA hydratase|nr:enoyl-CoA hydratase-related protein [Myxococcaceae bacterium]
MPDESIRLTIEGTTALITVDRPKALNALNTATLDQLEDALTRVAARPELRGLIVTGAGEKAFVAGADIAEMMNLTTEQALAFGARGHRVFDALERLPCPTLAAVNGFALGGGCELALACDLIYAAENARFGLPEVSLGVIPGFGGTQRLTRLVGRARAKELIFTGDMIDAARAKQIGLALEVVPAAQLLDHCRAVIARITKKGPLAVARAKRVIVDGADRPLAEANELERDAFAGLFPSADRREGMSAFLEKRPAAFRGV